MNFEQTIRNIVEDHDVYIDKNKFLDVLHFRREIKLVRRQQLISGFSMCLIIVCISLFSFNQMNNQMDYVWNEDLLINTNWKNEIEIENYLIDLSIMLVDASDDIWSTVEFLDEMNFDIINQIKEKTQ